MPLTVTQTPAKGSSAHEGLWYVVYQDTAYVTNDYQIVFDVHIGSEMFRIQRRTKTYVLSTTPLVTAVQYAAVDVAPIIRGYLLSVFNPINDIVTISANEWYVPYVLKIGENVGGTISPDLVTIQGRGYNNYSGLFPGSESSPLAGRDMKFLTDRDKVNGLYMDRGGELWVPLYNFYGGGGFVLTDFRLDVLNQAGSVVFTSPLYNLTDPELKQFRISNALIGGVLPATDDYFTIRVYQDGAPVSGLWDKLRVNYHDCAPKFSGQSVQLIYLNRYGGYESMSFTMANRYSTEIEREYFSRNQYQINPYPSVAGAFSLYVGRKDNNNRWQDTSVAMSSKHTNKVKLTGNWIPQAEYEGAKQLIASPEVYLLKDGHFYPVGLETHTWEQKLDGADKLFNLELEVNINRTINSQYR